MKRLIWALALGALVALFAVGCGISTGGGEGSAATTMQPIGPAAPPAARAEQPAALNAAEPVCQVAVFLRPVGADFDSLALSFGVVSLIPAEGEPTLLELAPAANAKADAYHLIAQGQVAPGKYQRLLLASDEKVRQGAITFATGEAAVPLRLPQSVTLDFDAVELKADARLLLVVTLDLADLAAGDEIAVAARRFRAAPLADAEACTLKGQVAPAASLARIYAIWAQTATPLGMTQADPFTGEYALQGLPPGRYHLRVTAAGHETYETREQPITLAPGKPAEIPPIVLTTSQVPQER